MLERLSSAKAGVTVAVGGVTAPTWFTWIESLGPVFAFLSVVIGALVGLITLFIQAIVLWDKVSAKLSSKE